MKSPGRTDIKEGRQKHETGRAQMELVLFLGPIRCSYFHKMEKCVTLQDTALRSSTTTKSGTAPRNLHFGTCSGNLDRSCPPGLKIRLSPSSLEIPIPWNILIVTSQTFYDSLLLEMIVSSFLYSPAVYQGILSLRDRTVRSQNPKYQRND